MAKTPTARPRKPARRSDPRSLARFVEELSWLLSSYDDLDFKALGSLTTELRNETRAAVALRNHVAHQPTSVNFLVGILPSLFIDETLFPSNEDISEFSQFVLGVNVPRWQKKSKYEIIGHIVCHTEQSDPVRLQQLVAALAAIVDKKGSARKRVESQRRSGISWNEVIQRLLSGAD